MYNNKKSPAVKKKTEGEKREREIFLIYHLVLLSPAFFRRLSWAGPIRDGTLQPIAAVGEGERARNRERVTIEEACMYYTESGCINQMGSSAGAGHSASERARRNNNGHASSACNKHNTLFLVIFSYYITFVWLI